MTAPPLATKLFLDSGDPAESRLTKDLFGRLDGQTTNPSLIAKNPDLQKRIADGEKLSREEANEFYKATLIEIAKVTDGPISVEVYADEHSSVDDLYKQSEKMFGWIDNAYIKYPITAAGLGAAEKSIAAGMRVNMTLCFTQQQAAAVYAATKGTKDPAFVSPFVGRLDDKGKNGMELIANILKMYGAGDNHVETLTASVRSADHLMYALALKSPLITAPLKVYESWAGVDYGLPGPDYHYDHGGTRPIAYEEVSLEEGWQDYDIHHPLTDAGQKKFAEDWTSLIAEPSAKA